MQENVTEKQEVKEKKLDDAVLEKLMEGKKKSTIRKEMHIGYNTVEEALNRLINGHIITFEEIAQYRREAKKKVFLKYIKEGFSKAQAGVKAHVPSGDIKNIVIEKFHIIDLIKFCITIYFPQKKNHHFLMFRMNILITILFKFVRWNLKKILQCLKNQESFLFQFYLILKFLRL